MVQNLKVLNSSYVGSRDLYWMDSPLATKGYNIYRSFDHPSNWERINTYPWMGHFYRDQVTLEEVTYIVKDSDWIDRGTLGKWAFQIPDMPYAEIVSGRPFIAIKPDSIQVFLDGAPFRPAEVQGLDRTVYLQVDNTLKPDGSISDLAPVNNGVVWQADYSGVKEVKVIYNKLLNYVDIWTGMVRTFYTVVPVGDTGEVHPPGARGTEIVNTQESEEISWEFAEMVRRNEYLFEQVGEPAYLLFRKTRGEICGCRAGGLNAPKTICKICFEVGIVGGYYGPYDFIYVPPDSAITRELDEGGGIKATRESKSYLTFTPIVQDGDIIVRRTGERMVINNVTPKSPRGVLLQQDFTTSMIPWGDTRMLIPINTDLPTLYNPVVNRNLYQGIDPHNLKGNGEPIYDVRVQPGKEPWENELEVPIGRSVTFGKIQS